MKRKKPPAKNVVSKAAASLYSDNELARLVWLAMFVSVFSFLNYYRNGDVLLYGDAVAHINIARRVFDSRTPGLLQLGTVWLPLPHLLILPFIVSKQMWQTGSGGSIPSMAGFVLGSLGMFRLARNATAHRNPADLSAKIAPWAAAGIYVANPNLIYMQATAMGESVYLAFFIWSVFYFSEFLFSEFRSGSPKALTKCGLCLAAACLTRYDGWFLTALMGLAILAAFYFRKARGEGAPAIAVHSTKGGLNTKSVLNTKSALNTSDLAKFILIAAASPLLWLAYNAAVYRNPLEFANGPYSAKAIELKTATVNPAKGNLVAAAFYFLKAAQLNVGAGNWPTRLWLALAVVGSFAAWLERRRAALLLWLPLPFYALSIAYGSIPIFVPTWWPFSIYNARYGLQLLPAFAVFVPMGAIFLFKSAEGLLAANVFAFAQRWRDAAVLLAVLSLVVPGYAAIWRADPICFREAAINGKGWVALDTQLGQWLQSLPPNSTLLMYLGEHVGALERIGIPLERTINEGNHRVWRQPSDSEGLWERALADPAAYADYAIGFEGDPVWRSATANHLTPLVELHTTGQSPAVIFQAREKEHAPPQAR